MKTPDQIADKYVNQIEWPFSERYSISATELADMIAAAIEDDRAQRAETHPDWQDDAEMYRDAAAVDISWRAWDDQGRQIGYSDAGITGAQAAAMFEAIGRTEA